MWLPRLARSGTEVVERCLAVRQMRGLAAEQRYDSVSNTCSKSQGVERGLWVWKRVDRVASCAAPR